MSNVDEDFFPDRSAAALLMLDMVNDFEFEDADRLLRHALPMARRLRRLKAACRQHSIPCLYVNDNFGRWQSNLELLVEHCLRPDCPGRPIVELLRPEPEDYFVLKPKNSGFYSTTLDTLLHYLRAERLILTGVAGNICVQFTANDAYLRDYQLVIPSDCVASRTSSENKTALSYFESVLKAAVEPSDKLDLTALSQPRGEAPGESKSR